MKTLFIAVAALIVASYHPARAVNASVPQPVQSLYTCAPGGLSRVALTSTACCNGAMSCPQLLSNTGLVRPRRINRT